MVYRWLPRFAVQFQSRCYSSRGSNPSGKKQPNANAGSGGPHSPRPRPWPLTPFPTPRVLQGPPQLGGCKSPLFTLIEGAWPPGFPGSLRPGRSYTEAAFKAEGRQPVIIPSPWKSGSSGTRRARGPFPLGILSLHRHCWLENLLLKLQ